MKVIPSKVAEVLKEHGLEKTCDVGNPINTDDDLADSFFRAGWDLALETGLLYTNTERIIKVEEEELRNAMREYEEDVCIGAPGTQDAVVVKHRKLEDVYPLVNICGALGNTVTEDMHIPILMSFAQHRETDTLIGGLTTTSYGLTTKVGEPTDYYQGIVMAHDQREAARRVNRPGIAISVVGLCGTPIGMAAMFPEVQRGDFSSQPAISELKVSSSELIRVAMCLRLGLVDKAFHHPMIGGYAGGPEGAAVMRVASSLLLVAVYQTPWTDSTCTDVRYVGANTSREAVWANSVSCQALAKNVGCVTGGLSRPVAGPGTRMLLYESAVAALNETTSGASSLFGPNIQTPFPNYLSGLEAKFSSHLTRTLCKTRFKREDANDIAKKLIPKYEDRLKNPPKGKPFQECMNIKTLKPTKEWRDIYLEVERELIDLGIPLCTRVQ